MAYKTAGSLTGFMTVVCAIFLLNAFKDWEVSLSSLQGLLQSTREQRGGDGDNTLPDITTALLEPAGDNHGILPLQPSGYQRIQSKEEPRGITVSSMHTG